MEQEPITQLPARIQTSALAITSLVLGILGLCCLGFLAGIPAVICGHLALSRIARSNGTLGGRGLAIAGLVTGYIGLVIVTLVILLQLAILLPAINKAHDRASDVKNKANLKGIGQALALYTDAGTKPMPPSLDVLIGENLIVEELLQSPHFNDAESDYILLHPGTIAPQSDVLVVEKAGGQGTRAFLWGDMNFVGDVETDLRQLLEPGQYEKYFNQ